MPRPSVRWLAAAALALVLAIGAGCALRPRAGVADAPVLGVAGDRLTVDGSPRFLVFLSYFDGLRRARVDGAMPDLHYLAGHVDGIRVLPNWWASTCPLRSGDDTLIDLDGHIRSSAWNALTTLLDAAAAEGLIVDLSFTRETVTDNGRPARVLTHAAYADALVELTGRQEYLLGRYPNVLIDVQNEWTRFASPEQMATLLGRVHDADPSRLLAASVSGDRYVVSGGDIPTMIAAYHDPRGRDWFTPSVVAEQVRAVKTLVRQPVYLQEPMPATSVCPGQTVDGDLAHHLRALAAARQSGAAAWTFHTRTAFDLSGVSLVEKLRGPDGQGEQRAIEELR